MIGIQELERKMSTKRTELQTERLHLFAPNIYIGIKGKIVGIKNIGELENAIIRAIAKVEVLHQKIVLNQEKKPSMSIVMQGE